MGISHATVVQLQAEGITSVDDLAHFDKDSLHQQLADNLRRQTQMLLLERRFRYHRLSLVQRRKRDSLWRATWSVTTTQLGGLSRLRTYNGTR